MMQISFVDIIEFIGTFAFAISGIRLASAKQFDLFGAFVVGLVTAIGGGTIRDVLLDVTPFWMSNPIYLIITALALIWVMVFSKYAPITTGIGSILQSLIISAPSFLRKCA